MYMNYVVVFEPIARREKFLNVILWYRMVVIHNNAYKVRHMVTMYTYIYFFFEELIVNLKKLSYKGAKRYI